MKWTTSESLTRANFDKFARVHYGDIVTHVRRDREIVGYEHHRESLFSL
jgi:hypothetical protein